MPTTAILVDPVSDCPVPTAEVPPRKGRMSRANSAYELLVGASCTRDPRAFTRAFTHAVHSAMAEVSGKPVLDFDAFHAKGQPCMRASPLTKRYGWAAHSDEKGKRALIDPPSPELAALSADPNLATKPAVRSRRGWRGRQILVMGHKSSDQRHRQEDGGHCHAPRPTAMRSEHG